MVLGLKQIEGANINKSLFALGNCINSLSEANEKNTKNVYIPYRDSKLTRLLKDSLGGNCKTIMVGTISPSITCYDDTLSTLKYATRTKNIKTFNVKNTYSISSHISRYTILIENLKRENEKLKNLIYK